MDRGNRRFGLLFVFVGIAIVIGSASVVIAQEPEKPAPGPDKPGAENPAIVIEPQAWHVGDVEAGQQVEKELTIKNTGGATLVLTNLRPSGQNIGARLETDRIDPGKSAKLLLGFVAPAAAGPVDSFVFISSNDPVTRHVKISITGSVVGRQAAPALGSFLFYSEDNAEVKQIRELFKNDLAKLGLEPRCISDVSNLEKLEELEKQYRVQQRSNMQLFAGGYYFHGAAVKRAIEFLRDGQPLGPLADEVVGPLGAHRHDLETKVKSAGGTVGPPPIVLDFFWDQGCQECAKKIQPLFQEHIAPFGNKVALREWNITQPNVVAEIYRSIGEKNVTSGMTLVAIVGGKRFAAGDETIMPKIKEYIQQALAEQPKTGPSVVGPDMSSPNFRAEDVTVTPGGQPRAGGQRPVRTSPPAKADSGSFFGDSTRVALLIMSCLAVFLVICLIVVARSKAQH
ncbi:MAG: DUF1573 domain-containing protein [Planctomycetota bacterium]|nr:DUF1573 domain-containing protein [Planctomycetota bacterium]